MLIKTDENRIPIQAQDALELNHFQSNQQVLDHESRESRTMAADGAGMDITNAEQRMGRPMSAWKIQQELQKIRPFLVFERANSDPTKTGIYIESPTYDPSLYKGRLIYVCGMESGMIDGVNRMIPEFSVINTEIEEVPDIEAPGGVRKMPRMKCEIRGWRSVLAALLKWKIISAHDVEKHFHVSLGRNSQRWHEVLEGRIEVFSEKETLNVRSESRGSDDSETETGAACEESPDSPDTADDHDGIDAGVDEGVCSGTQGSDSTGAGATR